MNPEHSWQGVLTVSPGKVTSAFLLIRGQNTKTFLLGPRNQTVKLTALMHHELFGSYPWLE